MDSDTSRLRELVRNRRKIRTSEVRGEGINPDLLYRLLRLGEIRRVGRGLYEAADFPTGPHEDLVEVALLIPRGVVCLLSALAYHNIGTQMPNRTWIALDPQSNRRLPRLPGHRIEAVWFSGKAFSEGQEKLDVGAKRIRVYSPAKTVADLFKFRFKLGLDVALEALQDGMRSGRFTVDELDHYARICRVSKVMRPYLQALTA